MWLDFRRKHEDFHLGFCFFHLAGVVHRFFMGMHESSTRARNVIRQYVQHHGAEYTQFHAALLAKGYEFSGEDYKRAMTKADSKDVYAFGQKRWFSYRKAIPLTDTMKPGFVAELQDYIRELIPMYTFLRRGLNVD